MTKYKLFVSLPKINVVYNIDEYEIIDNSFYKIFDNKTQTYRVFDCRICEIQEVEYGKNG